MQTLMTGPMIIIARLGSYVGHCRLTVHVAGWTEISINYMVLVFLFSAILCWKEIKVIPLSSSDEDKRIKAGVTRMRRIIQVLTLIYYTADVTFNKQDQGMSNMAIIFTGIIIVVSEALVELITKFQSRLRDKKE